VVAWIQNYLPEEGDSQHNQAPTSPCLKAAVSYHHATGECTLHSTALHQVTVNRGKAKRLKSCIKPQIIVVASPHEQSGYLFSGFPLSLPTSRSALSGSSVQDLRHWWYSLNGQSPTSRYQTYKLFKQLRPWTKIEADFINRILMSMWTTPQL